MLQTPPTTPEYVRLAHIRATSVQGSIEFHLFCETDERGEAFRASCASNLSLHLRPYASWLRSYQDGESVDQPVVPVRSINGFTSFDPSAAERDHPELVGQLNRFLNAGRAPRPEDFPTDFDGLS